MSYTTTLCGACIFYELPNYPMWCMHHIGQFGSSQKMHAPHRVVVQLIPKRLPLGLTFYLQNWNFWNFWNFLQFFWNSLHQAQEFLEFLEFPSVYLELFRNSKKTEGKLWNFNDFLQIPKKLKENLYFLECTTQGSSVALRGHSYQ